MPHNLHEKVAEVLNDIINTRKDLKMLCDSACDPGGSINPNQHLPFFLSNQPSRESAVSNVDLMIIKDGKVKLVCEIEESGINPTKIFGKIFSTACAKTCRLLDPTTKEHTFYPLDENAVFLQIIKNVDFSEYSLKEGQGQLIENEIYHKLKHFGSWIKHYRLIYGQEKDFAVGAEAYKELERIIKSF